MALGFLLHSRPYRETSLIATFMTDTDGRIDLLLRSARGGRNKKSQPILPFCLYELSWAGKGDIKHLQFFETLDSAIELSGSNLFCGFYLNELLYRLLPQHEPEHILLRAYSLALQHLANAEEIEPVLREFELTLLDALGYGLDLLKDKQGLPLVPGCRYLFVPEVGLSRAEVAGGIVAEAELFLAIARRDFADTGVRQLAKNVLRAALSVYLGRKPLRSRELFR
ncbi:MAG TPA: DNA repair protein RecO [Pseudomonadales bacterium]|nr:DNA repair protein RecO [Pseudomonadales bacterium]